MPPPSSWSPAVWTGPNIAAARPPPSAISGSTCKPSCPASPSWTPPVNTKAGGPAKCAPACGPGRLSSLTRLTWTSPIWPTCPSGTCSGSPGPRTISAAEWSAQTIADLYRCRWQIEVFFKQLKQTLQLADFLGNSANAVRWQVWTALLTYVLLRFCAWLSQWGHSFTRLFALLRSALWQTLELRSLLEVYGTAGGGGWFLGTPQQAFLAGFS